MSWVKSLYDLYNNNNNDETVGVIQNLTKGDYTSSYTLLPISHSTVTAQIEITINIDGNFTNARAILDDKKNTTDKFTIIPVTGDSSCKTSAPCSHPLCDVLKYVAFNYTSYLPPKSKDYSGSFELYKNELENWITSPYTHPKVEAIYKYIIKGTMIDDLCKSKVLKLDENGFLDASNKIQGTSQNDAFVRFIVQDGSIHQEVWKDAELQKSFISYYNLELEENLRDLCYITGEETVCFDKHPSKIMNEGDKSKLFSANDNSGFTYRGRFADRSESVSIGYESSQKVHNALKWIIRKQGYTTNGICFVLWESNLDNIVKPYTSTPETFDNIDYNSNDIDIDTNDNGEFLAQKFNTAISCRYKNQNNLNDIKGTPEVSRVYMISLNSATTGRLAVTYFNEMDTIQYLENVKFWHTTCNWIFTRKNPQDNFENYLGILSFKQIAKIIYGMENSNGFIDLKSDSKLYNQVFNRLLPCVINRKPIPKDMCKLLVEKASNPLAYDKCFKQVISLACAFVRKSVNDDFNKLNNCTEYKEVYTMSLDVNETNRSYLYGRLLAVVDKLERDTFSEDEVAKRQTSAMRYMSKFSKQPYTTWLTIYDKVNVYYPKLDYKIQNYYKSLIDDICNLFTQDKFENNSKLEGLYLLGFSHQRKELWTSKKDKNKEDINNTTETMEV